MTQFELIYFHHIPAHPGRLISGIDHELRIVDEFLGRSLNDRMANDNGRVRNWNGIGEGDSQNGITRGWWQQMAFVVPVPEHAPATGGKKEGNNKVGYCLYCVSVTFSIQSTALPSRLS